MNDGSAGFDEDGDAVVVVVDEPIEGHVGLSMRRPLWTCSRL
jgi:hypothetical protein